MKVEDCYNSLPFSRLKMKQWFRILFNLFPLWFKKRYVVYKIKRLCKKSAGKYEITEITRKKGETTISIQICSTIGPP